MSLEQFETSVTQHSALPYSDYVDIRCYERTIPCHALIDACNGLLLYRLIEQLGMPPVGKHVLDLGTGTGHVSRMLSAIPGLKISASDFDDEALSFLAALPEAKSIHLFKHDFLKDELAGPYDAVVCRGVYHHIPKGLRSLVIRKVLQSSPVFIIADEGIADYVNEAERIENCHIWYRYVIEHAKRIGLPELANIEGSFLSHEYLATSDDGGDYKEGIAQLREDVHASSSKLSSIDLIGDWARLRGGFFVATLNR